MKNSEKYPCPNLWEINATLQATLSVSPEWHSTAAERCQVGYEFLFEGA